MAPALDLDFPSREELLTLARRASEARSAEYLAAERAADAAARPAAEELAQRTLLQLPALVRAAAAEACFSIDVKLEDDDPRVLAQAYDIVAKTLRERGYDASLSLSSADKRGIMVGWFPPSRPAS